MFTEVQRIKIYIPPRKGGRITSAAFPKATDGYDFLADLIARIESHTVIGVLGPYSGVYELGSGIEGYIPREGSDATAGELDTPEQLQSIAPITYACVNDLEQIREFVAKIATDHPWEYPVIEVSKVNIWVEERFVKYLT